MPSVWRASTSTAARRSSPTAWPAAAATKSSIPSRSKPASGTRVTPGSRRRSGSADRSASPVSAGVDRYEPTTRTLLSDWSRTSWARRSTVGRRAQWRSSSTSSTGCVAGERGERGDHGAEQAGPLGVGVAVPDRRGQPEVGGPPGHEPGQLGRVPAEAPDRRVGRIEDGEERGRAPRRTAGTAPICSSEHVP